MYTKLYLGVRIIKNIKKKKRFNFDNWIKNLTFRLMESKRKEKK